MSLYDFNKDAWHAKFFNWCWETEPSESFNNMCPYFWIYIFTILFLPLILLGKLIYYIMPAKKKIAENMDNIIESKVGKVTSKIVDKIASQYSFWNIIDKIIKWLFIILLSSIALAVILVLLYLWYLHPIEGLTAIGAATLCILLIFAIFNLFANDIFWDIISKPFKIFGNMVYNLYNNICPIIKWK